MKFFLRCGVAALPWLLGWPADMRAQTASPHTQPGVAQPGGAGPITVQNPWARASAGRTGNSAAFLTLVGNGPADRLVSVSAPVAAKVELHETTNDAGIMKMRPVAGIDVVPGKPAVLAPGGLHIMLIGLTQPLRTGDRFPLTLIFAQAAPVTVMVQVAPAGAPGPGGQRPGDQHGHGAARH